MSCYMCSSSQDTSYAELTHAALLSNRISELGDRAPRDPGIWKNTGQYRRFRSSTISYIKSSTGKGLEFVRKAVENYNTIAKKAVEYNDFVTHSLAT